MLTSNGGAKSESLVYTNRKCWYRFLIDLQCRDDQPIISCYLIRILIWSYIVGFTEVQDGVVNVTVYKLWRGLQGTAVFPGNSRFCFATMFNAWRNSGYWFCIAYGKQPSKRYYNFKVYFIFISNEWDTAIAGIGHLENLLPLMLYITAMGA